MQSRGGLPLSIRSPAFINGNRSFSGRPGGRPLPRYRNRDSNLYPFIVSRVVVNELSEMVGSWWCPPSCDNLGARLRAPLLSIRIFRVIPFYLFVRGFLGGGAGEHFFLKKGSPASIPQKNQSKLSITQTPPRLNSVRAQLPTISLETAHWWRREMRPFFRGYLQPSRVIPLTVSSAAISEK